MFEEHKVLRYFRKEVQDHVDIIDGEVKKGNQEEASMWLNELLVMRGAWKMQYSRPGTALTQSDIVRGKKVLINTSSTKHLAKARLDILDKAIAKVRKMFQQKDWAV